MRWMLMVLAAVLMCSVASAKVERFVRVSSQTRDGWTKERLVEVEFLYGSEINRELGQRAYSDFTPFARIWFAQDQVAVIQLVGVGAGDMNNDSFKRLFIGEVIDGAQVNKGGPRTYRLRAKLGILYWIDPRAEE